MRPRQAAGFTMVELMIVLVISVPILLAVLSTTRILGRSVNTNERSADVAEIARRVAARTGQLLRAAHRSTFRVKATAADVTAGKASVVGEWITPVDLDPRPNLQFQTASGTLSMNATALTTPRELELVLDDAETANGSDDDGDGLIDEGRLMLLYDSTRTPLAEGVEACTFTLDGQLIRFTMQCAKPDADEQVHRATAQHVWLIRNP